MKRILLWAAGLLAAVAGVGILVTLFAYLSSDNVCDSAGADGERMKAISYCEYGTADVLRYGDERKPDPADNEVLVRVHAAALNPLDWHYMRGTPYLVRVGNGLRFPQDTKMGVDFAGVVAAVGNKVTRFKPGDRVFGGRNGAFAEYVVVPDEKAIVKMPADVSFEQAASVGIAATTALQGLRDAGHLQPGQKVLINGASGGVGTFAVQIAKSLGAEVTGVSSARNHAMLRAIGADHVIDYAVDDFTQGSERYDLILDLVGNHALLDLRSAMREEGICVLIGGGGPDAGNWVGPLASPIKALFLSPFVSQAFVSLLANLDQSDLVIVGDLISNGELDPVIDRRYPLSETAAAMRYLEEGHARGKVLLMID
ncbi:MAG TPA: NAD(P)-dependent alcohol dehydrogenase [Woeseiaceae bacterium]|nr:NAD(P)-dependent alcohol dehydrogenase [Woeseiaceae bacterium]